jgi:DNA polymerase III epsilon subunit-like protein
MQIQYEVYGCDCETHGLDPSKHEPIEISLYRLSTDECRTWCLAPVNPQNIEDRALQINGHKKDDVLHRTAAGRERYRKPADVLIEIENWVMEDGMPSENRILLGHNVFFDREMLVALWDKCGTAGTYPFNQKYSLDTMTLEFSLDYLAGTFGEGYALKNLAKTYKVKNDKSHTAESDTKTAVAIFRHQLERLKPNEDSLRGQ